jgi:DnaJ family protein A protein 5
MRCHYEVMELERSAAIADVKKQYKKLALKWHPDRNHGEEEKATQNFKEISASYAVLSDPNERKWYDDHRESILR